MYLASTNGIENRLMNLKFVVSNNKSGYIGLDDAHSGKGKTLNHSCMYFTFENAKDLRMIIPFTSRKKIILDGIHDNIEIMGRDNKGIKYMNKPVFGSNHTIDKYYEVSQNDIYSIERIIKHLGDRESFRISIKKVLNSLATSLRCGDMNLLIEQKLGIDMRLGCDLSMLKLKKLDDINKTDNIIYEHEEVKDDNILNFHKYFIIDDSDKVLSPLASAVRQIAENSPVKAIKEQYNVINDANFNKALASLEEVNKFPDQIIDEWYDEMMDLMQNGGRVRDFSDYTDV